MSNFAAKIDRFVRWFFNVSPTTTMIEPEPPKRRASSSSHRARPASPTGRRDARPTRSSSAARQTDREGA